MKNSVANQIYMSENQLFNMVSKLFDLVFFMEYIPSGEFMYLRVSEAAKKMALLTDDDIGKTITEIYPQQISHYLNEKYRTCITKNEPIVFRDQMNINTEERFGETILFPIFSGDRRYVLGLTRDVTRIVHLETAQSKDSITGLPLMDTFLSSLEQKFLRENFETFCWAFLYINVHQLSFFRYEQDSSFETDLLKGIVDRLKRFLNKEDKMSRVSGNEFILALRFENLNEINPVVEGMSEALMQSFKLRNNIDTVVTSSIGISVVDKSSLDVQKYISKAFEAMLSAKSNGKNQVVYANEKREFDRSNRTDELENDLYYAIEKEQISIHYQPKLNLQNNVISVEALLRWNHPKYGFVSPFEFIEIAESNKYIRTLGRWVLNQSCLDYLDLIIDHPSLTVAVNVSPIQLQDPLFIKSAKEIIKKHAIPDGAIELEITENAVMNIHMLQDQLESLNQAGFNIVLDDFGKSYSSMNYLKNLPVKKIKIDRCFIQHMDLNEKDQQIVQMMIQLALNLGMEITAEGVEKVEQLELLREMGCTEIQGYYYSKPIPMTQVEEFLTTAIAL